jgi:hypothetical protein
MNNGARGDEIRRRLAEVRAALAHDVQAAASDARTLADWREHFRAHPWLFCGAAAALGFFIIPRKNGETSRPQASDGTHVQSQDQPKPKTLAATALGMAASFAARQAGQYATQFAAEWWKSRRQADPYSDESPYSERGPRP